jgi:hypothetical protein
MSLPEENKEKETSKFVATIQLSNDRFMTIKSNEDYNKESDDRDDTDEREYDHEMTISEEAMNELHKKGETYITQTDGDETMVIKVKYQS